MSRVCGQIWKMFAWDVQPALKTQSATDYKYPSLSVKFTLSKLKHFRNFFPLKYMCTNFQIIFRKTRIRNAKLQKWTTMRSTEKEKQRRVRCIVYSVSSNQWMPSKVFNQEYSSKTRLSIRISLFQIMIIKLSNYCMILILY